MEVIDILETTTIDNFDEESYLLCNRDVYQSLSKGQIESGKYHFINNGQKENRLQLRIDVVKKLKNYKLAIIKNLLKEDYNQNQYLQNIAYSSNINIYNFLDENTKKDFHIVDTENVSQHSYDAISLKLIEYYQNGNILDFGAGFRRLNYKNVINYEIVQYASTDVLGVGEKLPFKDSSFDCIFSFAVLEHVQDPFACAKEIMRCLKPGGLLYTVVPHLQPYHGYPHHYYNMTHQGLANLFPDLQTLHQEVNYGNTVIWSISWILQRWNSCLSIDLQERF